MSNILIAEDDPLLADILRFNLTRVGHKVSLAKTGLLAMESLRASLPDVLVTDFQMPGANGEELCRFVREDLANAELPIIVCSAKGFELNATDFKAKWSVAEIVYKPFSTNAIVSLIGRLSPSVAVAAATV